jgi:RNA polymerase sigma factor (sigma-70 family)
VRRAYRIYNHRINRDGSEDIAQSVALLLIKNDSHGLRSFEKRSKLETWLQRVVNHEAARFFRGQEREVNVEDVPPGDLVYQPILDYEILRDEIVSKLTDDEWQLFELLEQGVKPKEIVEQLEIKPAHVYVLIYRLRKRIEKLLEAKGREEKASREDQGK